MRLDIFRVRTLRAANVAMLLVASGLFAMFFFNTLYLQRVLGYSPLEAGLAFLPFTAGIIIGVGALPALIPKLGAREVPADRDGARRRRACSSSSGSSRTARTSPTCCPAIMLASIGMGLDVRPGDADRDERASRPTTPVSRRGSSTRRSRSAARSGSRSSRRSRRARRPTNSRRSAGAVAADQASALVDGFHVAYLAGAILLGCAAIVLAVLLKREDVAMVSEGEAAPAVA